MNLHEYQAKEILKKYNLPIPPFFVVSSLKEVERLIEKEGVQSAVLKIQIHAGGRGKAGGVKMAHSKEEIMAAAKELLGKKIVNEQTGPQGMVASQLLLSEPLSISHEYYLGMTLSRERAEILLIASPIGGVNIEEVAQKDPKKVLFLSLPQSGEFRRYQMAHLLKFMGWSGSIAQQAEAIVKRLTEAFIESDASLLEINPLVKTKEDQLYALDAKLVVDENALYRQTDIKAYFDSTQLPASEAKAQTHDLAYVSLQGNIGCMVNGAGLAMATMDIIHHYGGRPANFLDVGGSATKEKVAEGFKIILSDPHVKVILINIFGGIMNCQTLAGGIIEAAHEVAISVPLVLRMEGTAVEEGKKLIREANLNIVLVDNMRLAAQKVVELSKECKGASCQS